MTDNNSHNNLIQKEFAKQDRPRLGQRRESFGLLDYNARFYNPALAIT